MDFSISSSPRSLLKGLDTPHLHLIISVYTMGLPFTQVSSSGILTLDLMMATAA